MMFCKSSPMRYSHVGVSFLFPLEPATVYELELNLLVVLQAKDMARDFCKAWRFSDQFCTLPCQSLHHFLVSMIILQLISQGLQVCIKPHTHSLLFSISFFRNSNFYYSNTQAVSSSSSSSSSSSFVYLYNCNSHFRTLDHLAMADSSLYILNYPVSCGEHWP